MTPAVELLTFEVIQQLGQGGTATVSRVRIPESGGEAALKHLSNSNSENQSRFLHLIQREYEFLAPLTFPGVVRAIDLSVGDPPYLLMELCPGPNLGQVQLPSDWLPVVNLISAVAIDLEYLRLNGLVHGDLKPLNIFLPSDWQNLRPTQLYYVKLTDFSMGRRFDEPEQSRAGAGTVGYIAPETITENRTSHRSDLFALGVTAFQILTGRHPFVDDKGDPARINAWVCEDDPPPLGTLRPDLPPAIGETVDRLLAKSEHNRPQSAWEVCCELENGGATYPFRKALHPKYIADVTNNQVQPVGIKLSDEDAARLIFLGGDDPAIRRLILSANFAKGNLQYDNGSYHFAGDIYWPACLRRDTLNCFRESSLSLKRNIIRAAICGGIEPAQLLGITSEDAECSIPPTMPTLLLPLLRSITVRRLSKSLAPMASKQGQHELAARLLLQAGDLEAALEAAYSAAKTLAGKHQHEAAVAIARPVIEFARMTGNQSVVRKLMMLTAHSLKETGQTERAEQAYNEILTVYQTFPPDELLAETHKDLGDLYKTKRNFRAGIQSLYSALKTYHDLNDELETSHTYNNLGNIHWIAQDTTSALKCFRHALRIQHRHGNRRDVASTLNNLGSVYGTSGKFGRANKLLELSLVLSRAEGSQVDIARVLNNIGYMAFQAGDSTRAIESLTESLIINRQIGTRKELLFNLENLASMMTAMGRLNESLQHLRKGVALAEELQDKPHMAAFHLEMGLILTQRGLYADAADHIGSAEELIVELDDTPLEVMQKVRSAELRLSIGDTTVAATLGREALAIAEDANEKPSLLAALCLLTRLSDDNDIYSRASKLADSLNTPREKRIIAFNRLERLTIAGRIDNAMSMAMHALPELGRIENELELARFHNIGADLLLLSSDHTRAATHLRRSETIAREMGLMEELATSLMLLGRLQLAERDYEGSYRTLREAVALGKQIVGQITGDSDRRIFQQRPALRGLASDVRLLGKLMTEKEISSV